MKGRSELVGVLVKHSGNEVIVIIGGFAGKFSVVTPRPKLVVVSCLLR